MPLTSLKPPCMSFSNCLASSGNAAVSSCDQEKQALPCPEVLLLLLINIKLISRSKGIKHASNHSFLDPKVFYFGSPTVYPYLRPMTRYLCAGVGVVVRILINILAGRECACVCV